MAGFNLDIGANTREFQRGVKDVEKGLDDVGDSLDDLTRESAKMSDKAVTGLDHTADKAQDTERAVDRLADSFRSVQGQVAKTSDVEFPNLAKKGEKAMFKVGDATGEFKQEALQNFSEVTSSFAGNASSLVDLAQGTFGGLAAALPLPLGLAAGAIAGVIGSVFSNMSAEADQAAKDAAQSVQDMYDDMKESGEKFVSDEFIRNSISDLIKDEEKLKAVRKDAADAGVSVQTALRAEAGDRDALNAVLSTSREQLDALNKKAVDSAATMNGPQRDALGAQILALEDVIHKYEGLGASQDTASSKATLYRQSVTETSAKMQGLGRDVKGVNDALAMVPKHVSVSVDANTATAEAKLRALAARPLSILVDAHTRAGDRVF